MWQRRVSALIFVSISGFGCSTVFADSNNDSAVKSGVAGNVKVSPSCPGPQRTGQECVAPYSDALVQLLNAAGVVVSSATTDNEGHFVIRAPAGDYQVRVNVEGLYPRCESTSVRILNQTFVQTVIRCDSGMR